MLSKVKRIWIIDSDDVSNFIIQKQIEIHRMPFIPSTHPSGELALEHLIKISQSGRLTQFPEIILLNLRVPFQDGFDFMENYEQALFPKFPNTRIHLMSTLVRRQDEFRASHFGSFSGFLKKPMNVEDLQSLNEYNKHVSQEKYRSKLVYL